METIEKLKKILPYLMEHKSIICDEPHYIEEGIKELLMASQNIENDLVGIGILHVDLAKTFVKHVLKTHDKFSPITAQIQKCTLELKRIKKILIGIEQDKSRLLQAKVV